MVLERLFMCSMAVFIIHLPGSGYAAPTWMENPCYLCRSRYRKEYYHQIMDCLIPLLPMYLEANRTGSSLCVDQHMKRWTNTLTGISSTCVGICDNRCKKQCPFTKTTHAMLMSLTHETNERDYIIVISREGRTRMILDEPALVSRLEMIAPVKRYTGAESVTETMALFHNARAVVGYHGAGFGNTVFCKNGTRIVEVTTMLGDGSLWRRNLGNTGKWGTYRTLHLYVPVSNLLTDNGVLKWNVPNTTRAYKGFLKHLKVVVFGPQIIETVASFFSGH